MWRKSSFLAVTRVGRSNAYVAMCAFVSVSLTHAVCVFVCRQATGYDGPLCAHCMEGYSKQSAGGCAPCTSSGTIDQATKNRTTAVAMVGACILVAIILIIAYGVEEFVVLVREWRIAYAHWRAKRRGAKSPTKKEKAQDDSGEGSMFIKKTRIYLHTAKRFGGEKTKM